MSRKCTKGNHTFMGSGVCGFCHVAVQHENLALREALKRMMVWGNPESVIHDNEDGHDGRREHDETTCTKCLMAEDFYFATEALSSSESEVKK